MSGNLWEWTADWYDLHYYSQSPVESPTGPAAGLYRVIRGGSWADNESRLLTVYSRNFTAPDTAQPTIGFRCVRPALLSRRSARATGAAGQCRGSTRCDHPAPRLAEPDQDARRHDPRAPAGRRTIACDRLRPRAPIDCARLRCPRPRSCPPRSCRAPSRRRSPPSPRPRSRFPCRGRAGSSGASSRRSPSRCGCPSPTGTASSRAWGAAGSPASSATARWRRRSGEATPRRPPTPAIPRPADRGRSATRNWSTDFAYRAVHEMTVKAKAIVAAFYGTRRASSYFVGCSTGGARDSWKRSASRPTTTASSPARPPTTGRT